jgi:hypothetical protein
MVQWGIASSVNLRRVPNTQLPTMEYTLSATRSTRRHFGVSYLTPITLMIFFSWTYHAKMTFERSPRTSALAFTMEKTPLIRSLVLNAAFLQLKTRTWTEDGFDMTFAASYLVHWILTMMLLGSMDQDIGRIVVVGISVHE